MKSKTLYFTKPEQVEISEDNLPSINPDQVLVRTIYSGISAGTEMLAYRGEVEEDMALDETIGALEGSFHYPFRYGYACVGQVIEVGLNMAIDWMGKRVFAFQPHASCFLARPDDLMVIPDDVKMEDAIFLPNMETALNFVMDGRPMVGEITAVFGLGVVGLLTTAVLAQFPLGGLVCFDRYQKRRELALELGCTAAIDPQTQDALRWPSLRKKLFEPLERDGFDLSYELSGSPAALDQTIKLTGFGGRVVIGSWYGTKGVSLGLGGRFHRSRMHLVSSQVSTIAPELQGSWSKTRRFQVAWEQLRRLNPSRWITQRFPLERADEAYRLLDEHPQDALQVIFDYRQNEELERAHPAQ